LRASRRKELEAQRAALDERLDRLKAVLRDLVTAAKKRSGVEDAKPDKKESPATKAAGKKDRDKSSDKPLSEKQKREKREASREQYQKEKGTSLSTEVQELEAQVKDIRAKIEKAIADARQKSSQPKSQTAPPGR
jgi:hypothetical protein